MPQIIGEPPGRIAPVAELVNTLEFVPMAQRKLDAATWALIADGDRGAFGRMTFRPRMMVNTTKLDLTTTLFGRDMFTPILIGPLSGQKRFHPEGELAMARGASATKAVMMISDRSSNPVQKIAAESKADVWYQVFPETDVDAVRNRALAAVTAGCRVVCLTTGGWDWTAIDRFRKGMTVPVVLKGITSPEKAKIAADRDIQGIVVSNNVEPGAVTALPGIVDAVGGRIPILVDGGFRRGSDVLMALALGARAIMIGRPALWGLAAYGAEGVQKVIELMQTELARDMAMCGRVNIKAIDRSLVKVHRS
jgi:4-hydroxymandelate oxidase